MYHAIFTRHGGISPTPWKSLNLGGSVGDDPVRVAQNRQKALAALDINPLEIFDTYQVHSTEVIQTDRPFEPKQAHQKADGIITNKAHLTLMMRFADCVPILLFDPSRHAIGIAHAGWIGTINKIGASIIMRMKQSFGTNPTDVIAAIGPSIGPDHYSVGSDVIDKVRLNFGSKADELIASRNGRSFFDLWKANQMVLNEAGVEHIEIAGLCTNCDLDNWYSHRGEYGSTGRFGAVIGLY